FYSPSNITFGNFSFFFDPLSLLPPISLLEFSFSLSISLFQRLHSLCFCLYLYLLHIIIHIQFHCLCHRPNHAISVTLREARVKSLCSDSSRYRQREIIGVGLLESINQYGNTLNKIED